MKVSLPKSQEQVLRL